ncbi:MAG: NUDIX domain-containing protein [Candidatus Paceibacterota bacterium]
MAKETAAGFIIYRETKQGIKFLLLYHGGKYWGFPKGKLEKGEDYRSAAVREIEEETALKRRDLRVHPSFKRFDKYNFSHKGEKIFKVVTYLLAESKKKSITISPREHSGYAWFLYKDARDMLFYKNLKNNLKSAYDTIRNKSSKSSSKNTKRRSKNLQTNSKGNKVVNKIKKETL